MNKKRILVSGASGFLGKELVRQLIKNDYSTIALTSKPEELMKFFGNQSNLVVLNVDNWTERIGKDLDIHVFINCAFPRSSKPEQLAIGLDFTEKMIKEVIGLGVHNIINISSQSVYSQKDKSAPNENSEVAPESLYGIAKYAAEKLVAILCERNDRKVNYSNIRLASLTGIGLESRMTNKFVKTAIEGGSISVNGRGQKVSYLDVRDAASALIAMINKDANKWCEIYNLGSCFYNSVLEIAESVNEIAKKYLMPGIEIGLKEGFDNFNNLVNSKAFYNDFNWRPKYDMTLIIENLFNYYLNEK